MDGTVLSQEVNAYPIAYWNLIQINNKQNKTTRGTAEHDNPYQLGNQMPVSPQPFETAKSQSNQLIMHSFLIHNPVPAFNSNSLFD